MTSSRTFTLSIALAGAVAAGAIAAQAQAGSIENLERERTIRIENLLTPDLSAEERQAKLSVSKRRLLDLERIALRDKSLVGRNTPAIKRAFSSYDLTFLVHASVEKNRDLADHWLEQVGVTEQDVLSAVDRRR
jgi:pimeloyl-CoA synthetase